jgi:hypothetical protein
VIFKPEHAMNHHYFLALKSKVIGFLLALMLGSPGLLWAAGSAQVDFVVGSALASNTSGVERKLVKGTSVVSGETIRTAADSRVHLRFDDGAVISLQPLSEFRLDNYHFAGKPDGEERGFFSLIKGGLRTITGLIGRNKRDAYKVTTSVATIGIRGTEYTLVYTDSDSIAVATGEGAIEVCNDAGCKVLASGESAVVKGKDGAIELGDYRPQLAPPQPIALLLPQFSTAEYKNQDGSVQINSNQLLSGPGYVVAYTHVFQSGVSASGDAQFGPDSQFLYGTSASSNFTGVVLGESASLDGVIGWGRWVTAQGQTPPSAPVTLTDFHYAVGQPTPLSGLGASATYQLVGATAPTGVTANGPLTGSLTANFTGGGMMNVSMNVNIPTSASVVSINTNTGPSPVAVSSTFTWDSVSTNVSGGGFFAGANASHAGASYNTGSISGAAAFKR